MPHTAPELELSELQLLSEEEQATSQSLAQKVSLVVSVGTISEFSAGLWCTVAACTGYRWHLDGF